MSRKSGDGNLQKQDTIILLEAIASRLNDSRIKYWVIGGVLRDIIELGEIAGPHKDIDFYVYKQDRGLVYECLCAYTSQNGMNPNDADNTYKLTYTWDGIKEPVSNKIVGQFSVEFIFLNEQEGEYSSKINGNDKDKPKNFSKKLIGQGILKSVHGLSTKVWIPSCPLELLEQLEA